MAIFDSKISKSAAIRTRWQLDFQFGRELKGQNKTIATMTRSNSLFLSEFRLRITTNNYLEYSIISKQFED